MPRYFFDLVDDKKIYDKKGVSLPNDKAAREYAKTFARELMETKSHLMVGPGLQRQVRSHSANPVLGRHRVEARRVSGGRGAPGGNAAFACFAVHPVSLCWPGRRARYRRPWSAVAG
jgi:hypothetical protein